MTEAFPGPIGADSHGGRAEIAPKRALFGQIDAFRAKTPFAKGGCPRKASGPDCVADPSGNVSCRCFSKAEKEEKGHNKDKKDKLGRTSPDQETPLFESPLVSGPRQEVFN